MIRAHRLAATPGPAARAPVRRHGDGSGGPAGIDFAEIVDHWLELSYALNQVNRSMGHDDLYPFVLAPKVTEKLAFVDHLVRH